MSMNITRIAAVVAAAIAGISTSAFALDPQSMTVSDGLLFTPTLMLQHGHDNNIHQTKNNRKSSWITTLEPTLKLSLDRAKSAHELKYRMRSENFHASKDSSHIDHHFTANTGLQFDARNRLLLNAGYHKMQDAAIEQVYSGSRLKNDKWNSKNIGGEYIFGANTALTQVEFAADYDELRYDNGGRTADGQRINSNRERDTISSRLTGYYQVAPKTKLLLEGTYKDYDYKSNSNADSKNKALLAGLTWTAAAKTTGTVKAGREKKTYKNSSQGNGSTSVWEAGVVWAPLAYSTFTVKTRRGYDETSNFYDVDGTGGGLDYIDHVTNSIKTKDSSIAWKHYWMDRLYSEASYKRVDRQYQDIDRDDKIDQYGLGLTYQARRWLDVGLGFSRRDNNSSVNANSYTRNVYALTFNASL